MSNRLLISYLVPGKAVTKKNSQQMARNPKTGRWFPVPSKQYKEYEKLCKQYIQPPEKPISEPVNVRCVYHLPLNKDGSIPKLLPDLTNLLEATDDILVKYKVLEDDNVSIVFSHDGSHACFCDPKDQCTEIYINALEDT